MVIKTLTNFLTSKKAETDSELELGLDKKFDDIQDDKDFYKVIMFMTTMFTVASSVWLRTATMEENKNPSNQNKFGLILPVLALISSIASFVFSYNKHRKISEKEINSNKADLADAHTLEGTQPLINDFKPIVGSHSQRLFDQRQKGAQSKELLRA